MTLSQAIETHLHHLRSELHLDPKSVGISGVTLARLRAFMPHGSGVSCLTLETLRGFIASEFGSGYAARTVALRRDGVLRFCAHMADIGEAPATLAKSLPRVRRGFTLPKPASIADIAVLIDAIVGDAPVDLRDRAMFELAYSAGLRASELVGLTVSRVDLQAGEARVNGKGGIERIAPVGERACEAIARYLKDGRPRLDPRGANSTLFLNFRGGPIGRMGFWWRLKVRSIAAGLVTPIHPHMLRHSCATHMLEHGADLRVVQETLGHRSITSTQVYTLVTRSRLRAEHRKHHPRG